MDATISLTETSGEEEKKSGEARELSRRINQRRVIETDEVGALPGFSNHVLF